MQDLVLGPVDGMSQEIDITGGLGVILGSATTTTAGLMSAADKATIDDLDSTYIKQGGNPIAGDIVFGMLGNHGFRFETGGTPTGGIPIATLDSGGSFAASSVKNIGGSTFSYVGLTALGTIISRGVVDTNPPLTVNRGGGTGNIQLWQDAGTQKAFVDGQGTFGGAGLKNNVTGNNAQVHVTNDGTVITRSVADSNPVLLVNQLSTSSTGNTITVQKNSTNQLTVSNSGVLTVDNLAGTGTRIVTADSSGSLSTVTNNFITSISGTANRISVSGTAIDIASTYIGQTSITTLGTISTGTWNGSTIGVGYGGTGLTSAGASGNVLMSDGSGWVSTTPTWVSNNIYTANGTLTDNRTIYMSNYGISFLNNGSFEVNGAGYIGLVSYGDSVEILANNGLFIGNTTYSNYISWLNLTASRNWFFPDADGTLALTSDITDQWTDLQGYSYLGADSPGLGAGKGLDSQGGYASNYQELNMPSDSVDDNVEFVYRIDPTNSDCTLYLPDPSLFPKRVLNITNCSTDTNAGIIMGGSYLPMNTEIGITIDYLSSLKGDPTLAQWIQIMSIQTTVNGTPGYYWMVMKAGRKFDF